MFFTSISQMMTESVDLTLVIRKANGQLTVSTLPKANGLKDEAANHIIPLTLTGTPEEMDAEFLQHIMQPIRKATGLISNLMEFEQQADKAAANSRRRNCSWSGMIFLPICNCIRAAAAIQWSQHNKHP